MPAQFTPEIEEASEQLADIFIQREKAIYERNGGWQAEVIRESEFVKSLVFATADQGKPLNQAVHWD